MNITRFAFCTVFCAALVTSQAQNLILTYENPPMLSVCDSATLRIQLQNTGNAIASAPVLTVGLPSGLSYVLASVSGATEGAGLNPAAPVFTLPDLAPGASASCAIRLRAECAAADRLDAGQLFPIALTAQSGAANATVTTLPIKVETGLLRIESIEPASGTYGDTIRRKICFRNTRLGTIQFLRFEDERDTLRYRTWMEGAVWQKDDQAYLQATFNPDIFKAFGNNDAFLDPGETACVQQVIVIQSCGPDETNSRVRLGWRCDSDPFCRYDSALSTVTFTPYPKKATLKGRYVWQSPSNRCGQSPSAIQVVLRNTGNAPAQELLCLATGFKKVLGASIPSFRVRYQGAEKTADVFATPPNRYILCGKPVSDSVFITFPEIAPGDSLTVDFETFYCTDSCNQSLPTVRFDYFYRAPCPKNAIAAGRVWIEPDTQEMLRPLIITEIGDCLQPGESKTWTYTLKSKRLLAPEGRIRLLLDLPFGLTWAEGCLPDLVGGAKPEVVNHGQQVEVFLPLPLNTDSIAFPFCLHYECHPDLPCEPPPPQPRRLSFNAIYVGQHCEKICNLKMGAMTSYQKDISPDFDCAISVCQKVTININFTCGADTIKPNPVDCGPGGIYAWDFKPYRINYDYADDDDDRNADPGLLPAEADGVRRDRFLKGDTLRVEYRGAVKAGGGLLYIPYIIWHELTQRDQHLGTDVADPFDVAAGQGVFTNFDRLKFLRRTIAVFYKNGTTVRFPLSDTALYRSDQHYYKVTRANVIPEEIHDQMVTQRHEFGLNLLKLYNDGLLPKPTLDEGDEVAIFTDFHIDMNFVALSPNYPDPPLVNFRTAMDHEPAPYAWDSLPYRNTQYSGYRTWVDPHLVSIRACANSFVPKPFHFILRIARPNLFPYEVRPLVQLTGYQQTVPAGLTMQSAQLRYLVLQDSVPVFSNRSIAFNQQNGWANLDFNPFFTNPLDEGFSMQAFTQFPPACNFTASDSSRLYLDFESKHGLYFKENFNLKIFNPIGYFPGAPTLSGAPRTALLVQATRDFSHDFELRNNFILATPNFWVSPVSPSGNIGDLVLQDAATQQPITPNAQGVYQLGTVAGFSRKTLRLIGKSKSCGVDSLLLVYGWGCSPVNSLAEAECGRDTLVVKVEVQKAELELDIVQEPEFVELCGPSEEYELEIYNANEGYTYGLVGRVKLPQGVRVAPGSCRVSYPVGTPFQTLADPNALPGNQYEWILSDLLPTLAAQGLPGINKAPQHALRLRFRVIADCGFAANLPPIYGAGGVSSCELASNTLNKPGKPMRVAGLGIPYEVQATLKALDGPAVCGGTQRFEAILTLLGRPNPGDSALVVLPPGVSYVPGSYLSLENAPTTAPTLQSNGFRVLIPAGLPASTVLRFAFTLRFGSDAGCLDPVLSLQTRIRANAFCPTLGSECGVFIATGSASLPLALEHPNFGALNPTLRTEGGVSTLSFTLTNLGNTPTEKAQFELWRDVNGDGTIGAGDRLLGTWDKPGTIAPGQNATLQQALGGMELPCGLLLRLPALANCACSDKVFPLEQYSVRADQQAYCAPQAVPIGVSPQPGFSYVWVSAQGLSCVSCPSAVFTPGSNAGPGSTSRFELLEQKTGCAIRRTFEVVFGPELAVAASATQACRGSAVVINATQGLATYQWFGPGANAATGAVLTVKANAAATYSVVGIFGSGCRDTAQITISVLPADTMRLPERTTCPGEAVPILGQNTAQAGTYQLLLKNRWGCDSLLLQTLRVLPQPTGRSERTFCQGDTLRLFDTLLTSTATVCRRFKGQNGCDSLHCATGRMVPKPVLPQPDTTFGEVGQPVTLQAPPGFADYRWSPRPLACDSCPALTLRPDTTGLYRYRLDVLDANRCGISTTYLLFVFPPCDPVKILLPNAFTPNGDGLNDVFRPIEQESLPFTATLQIYNRWGQKLHESTGSRVFWDGTVDGEPAPMDAYIFLLEITCDGGKKGKRWGDVSLVR